jgi:hypothetical protein
LPAGCPRLALSVSCRGSYLRSLCSLKLVRPTGEFVLCVSDLKLTDRALGIARGLEGRSIAVSKSLKTGVRGKICSPFATTIASKGCR